MLQFVLLFICVVAAQLKQISDKGIANLSGWHETGYGLVQVVDDAAERSDHHADDHPDEDAGTEKTQDRNDHAESDEVFMILVIVLGVVCSIIILVFTSWAIACCQASSVKAEELERIKQEGIDPRS